MATANGIIRQALMAISVVTPGQATRPQDSADALIRLNTMLDAWRADNLYAYRNVRVSASLPANTESRTIGPAGQFVSDPRPVRIEDGSFWTAGGIDYPLTSITEAEYNAIGLKAVSSLGPGVFWYDPAFPTGTIRFNPRAASAVTVTLLCQVHLTEFSDLTTVYDLPPGYERAISFSLAEELAADYEREVPATVARIAASSRRSIQSLNVVIPQLQTGPAKYSHTERFYMG